MKLLLLSVVLLGAPLQAQAPARTFEVASIKINKSNERARTNIVPGSGRLVITAMTVQEVIQAAYMDPPEEEVSAAPPEGR